MLLFQLYVLYMILKIKIRDKDLIFLKEKEERSLKNKDQFVAFNGDKEIPKTIPVSYTHLTLPTIYSV